MAPLIVLPPVMQKVKYLELLAFLNILRERQWFGRGYWQKLRERRKYMQCRLAM